MTFGEIVQVDAVRLLNIKAWHLKCRISTKTAEYEVVSGTSAIVNMEIISSKKPFVVSEQIQFQ